MSLCYLYAHKTSGLYFRVCPNVQFYTKRAVIVLICAALTANLCSYNLLQCNATWMFSKILCIFPSKISPKADRLLACAVPANFHYVNAPLVATSLLRTVIAVVAWFRGWLSPPKPYYGQYFFKTESAYGTYLLVIIIWKFFNLYPWSMLEDWLFFII